MTKDDIEKLIGNLESNALGRDKVSDVVREVTRTNQLLSERLTVNAVLAYNDEKVNMVEWTRRVSSLLASCQLLLGIGVFLLLAEVVHHW
jgi:hypothetical protein